MIKRKGAFAVNRHKYDIYKCDEQGHVLYASDEGVLCNNSTHVSWEDLIQVMNERGINESIKNFEKFIDKTDKDE